jgi:mono/diheme cytochrome c family protein
MAMRVSLTGHAGNGPRNVAPLRHGVAALLSVSVVVATLAALAVPAMAISAMAIPASAETAATTSGRGPVSLSGTISYAFSYSATGNCAGCHTSESLSVSMAVSGQAVSDGHNSPDANSDNPDVYRCVLAANSGSKCFWAPLTVDSASLHYHFATQVAVPGGCHTQASATGSYKAVSAPSPLGLDIVFNPVHGRGRGLQPGPAPQPRLRLRAIEPPGISPFKWHLPTRTGRPLRRAASSCQPTSGIFRLVSSGPTNPVNRHCEVPRLIRGSERLGCRGT